MLDDLERYVRVTNENTHERYRIEMSRWTTRLLEILGSVQDHPRLNVYVAIQQPFMTLLFLAHRIRPEEYNLWLPEKTSRDRNLIDHLRSDLDSRNTRLSALTRDLRSAESKVKDLENRYRETESSLVLCQRRSRMLEDNYKLAKSQYHHCLQTKSEIAKLFFMSLRGAASQQPQLPLALGNGSVPHQTWSRATGNSGGDDGGAIEQAYIHQLNRTLHAQERRFRQLEGSLSAAGEDYATGDFFGGNITTTAEPVVDPFSSTTPPSFSPPLEEENSQPMIVYEERDPENIFEDTNESEGEQEEEEEEEVKEGGDSGVNHRLAICPVEEEDERRREEGYQLAIATLETHLGLANRRIEEMRQELMKQDRHLYELTENLRSTTGRLAEADLRLDQSGRAVTEWEDLVTCLREEKIALESRVRSLNGEVVEWRDRLSQEQSEHERLRRQIADACTEQEKALLDEHRMVIEGLRQRADEQSGEFTALQTRCTADLLHLKGMHEEATRVATDMKTERDGLSDANAHLRLEKDRLLLSVNELTRFVREIKSTFALRHDLPLSGILKEVIEAQSDLTSENAAMHLETDDLKSQLDVSSRTVSDLRTEVERLEAELESVVRQATESKGEMDESDDLPLEGDEVPTSQEKREDNNGFQINQEPLLAERATNDKLRQALKKKDLLVRSLLSDRKKREQVKQLKRKIKRSITSHSSTQVSRPESGGGRFRALTQCQDAKTRLEKHLSEMQAAHVEREDRLKEKHERQMNTLQSQLISTPTPVDTTATHGQPNLDSENKVNYYNIFLKLLETFLGRFERTETLQECRSVYLDLVTLYRRFTDKAMTPYWNEYEALLHTSETPGGGAWQHDLFDRTQPLTLTSLQSAEMLAIRQELREQRLQQDLGRQIIAASEQLFTERGQALLDRLQQLSAVFSAPELTSYLSFFSTFVKDHGNLAHLGEILSLLVKRFGNDHLYVVNERVKEMDALVAHYGFDTLNKLLREFSGYLSRTDEGVKFFTDHIDLTNASHKWKFKHVINIMMFIFKASENLSYPPLSEMERKYIIQRAKAFLELDEDPKDENLAIYQLLESATVPRKIRKRKSYDQKSDKNINGGT